MCAKALSWPGVSSTSFRRPEIAEFPDAHKRSPFSLFLGRGFCRNDGRRTAVLGDTNSWQTKTPCTLALRYFKP